VCSSDLISSIFQSSFPGLMEEPAAKDRGCDIGEDSGLIAP